MTKFMKNLLIINGILVPTVIVCSSLNYLRLEYEQYKRNKEYDNSRYEEPGTKTAGTFVDTKGDTLVFQGINFSEPKRIPDTKIYYIAVHPVVYKEPELRKNSLMDMMCMDVDLRERSYEGEQTDSWEGESNCANIIFLDENYRFVKKFIDKKAHISHFNFLNDTRKKGPKLPNFILASIAYKDDNKDGIINKEDKHDYFICDIDGGNMNKIMSNKDLHGCKTINSRTELFITYVDRNGKKEEHQREKFAIYNIANKTFRELTDISQALNETEKILNKK